MNLRSFTFAVLLCAASASQAQDVTTGDGEIVMVEKNQAVVVLSDGTTVVQPIVTTTTLLGGLTVGTAVVGGLVGLIFLSAIGSGTGT